MYLVGTTFTNSVQGTSQDNETQYEIYPNHFWGTLVTHVSLGI
jgi:hypothetical protein